MQKQTKKKSFWLLAGIVAALFAAPNAAVIRTAVLEIDPIMFNMLRFGVVALILTPYLIAKRATLKGVALKEALKVGAGLSLATISFVCAVKMSQASYVAIIMLLSPIFFILLAAKINSDTIDRRAFAGVALAAIGAFVVVLLPIAISQSGGTLFYPLATLLALITAASFPLAVIYTKRAHAAGMSIPSVVGIGAWVAFAASLLVMPLLGEWTNNISTNAWMGVLYVAIVIQLCVRAINSAVYEKLGAAGNSVLAYLEGFLAVLVPTIFLGEKLSPAMVLGGALILGGVYLVEYRRRAHHEENKALRQFNTS